jgi:hypothetical protein
MRVTAVDSTALASIGYDEARELLQLEFCARVIYHYFGVPAAVNQALLDTPSKGSYFSQTIRGRFSFCLLSDRQADPPDGAMPTDVAGRS